MFDWDATVLAPNFEIFSEAVTIAPVTPGAISFGLAGVFDEGYIRVDPDSGMPVTSVRPRVGLRAYDLTVAGQIALGFTPPVADYALPAQGDYVRIERTQGYYRIKEVQPDSHGHLHVEMNKVTDTDLAVAMAKFSP